MKYWLRQYEGRDTRTRSAALYLLVGVRVSEQILADLTVYDLPINRLPLRRVTPCSAGRCHEVTEGTGSG